MLTANKWFKGRIRLPLLLRCDTMERKRGTEEEGAEQAYKKARRDDSDSEYTSNLKQPKKYL